MQYMRALKIIKPIYTLGIKILTLPESSIFCGKCHDFHNPCTIRSRDGRRKKDYFFFKVRNQGRDCCDS